MPAAPRPDLGVRAAGDTVVEAVDDGSLVLESEADAGYVADRAGCEHVGAAGGNARLEPAARCDLGFNLLTGLQGHEQDGERPAAFIASDNAALGDRPDQAAFHVGLRRALLCLRHPCNKKQRQAEQGACTHGSLVAAG